MSLRTLFGFLSPKLLYSAESLPVETFPLSSRAVLLYGGEGEPGVKPGDEVKSGQSISPGLRSTVTGRVSGISELKWLEGKSYKAIEIETSGDEWDSSLSGEADAMSKSAEELTGKLRDAGFNVEGLQGNDTVVINGVDSDLLVCISEIILKEKGESLKNGINLIKHIAGAKNAVLAVTGKNMSLANNIAGGIAGIIEIKPAYPNGASRIVALRAGDGKTCVVNAETLCAMADCIGTGKPFTEKAVTLIGKGGAALKNLKVRIGTPVSEILRANNITLNSNDKLILGGPMKGPASYTEEFPVTAETDAIMIQGADEVAEVLDSPCIGCGKCVGVCPFNLQINLLSRCAEFSHFEKCEELDIDFCIECGMCAYVCPSRRPLVQYVQFAKNEIMKLKAKEQEKEEE